MEIYTNSASETKKAGERLSTNLKTNVIALVGDLGSGKTTFVQGLAKGLGITERIISPTFIIVREYGVTNDSVNFKKFYHIDLYRLDNNIKNELENIGFSNIVSDPKNIVVVEWADKAKSSISINAKWVEFVSLGNDRRSIIVKE